LKPTRLPSEKLVKKSSVFKMEALSDFSPSDPSNELEANPELTTKTEIIKHLSAIMEDISGIEFSTMDPSATFLELGLDSLLLTPLIFKVKKEFGVRVTLKMLVKEFSRPSTLAAHLLSRLEVPATDIANPNLEISSVDHKVAASASVSSTQNWLIDHLANGGDNLTISVTLKFKAQLNPGAIEWCLQQIVAYHIALRTTVSMDARTSGVGEQWQTDFLKLRLHGIISDKALNNTITEKIKVPFDLKNGPLFRGMLISTDANADVLVLSASSLICDLWSMDSIVESLARYYRLFCKNDLSVENQSGSNIQSYLLALPKEAKSDFWKRHSVNYLKRLEAHNTIISSYDPVASAHRSELHFDQTKMDSLRTAVSQNSTSLFATIAAAFTKALTELEQNRSHLMVVSMAGQAFSNQPNLVGQCVNLVPLPECRWAGQNMSIFSSEIQTHMFECHEHQNTSFVLFDQISRDNILSNACHLVHIQRLSGEQTDFSIPLEDYYFNTGFEIGFRLEGCITEYKNSFRFEIHSKDRSLLKGDLDKIIEEMNNNLSDFVGSKTFEDALG